MPRTANITVHAARQSDWPAIARIDRRDDIPIAGHCRIVARLGGVAVGYLAYRVDGGECVVSRVAVAPGLRRSGVGTALVRAVMAHVRDSKRRQILSATVHERDRSGLLFLRGVGGFQCSLVRDEFGDDDGIRFEYAPKEPFDLGGES